MPVATLGGGGRADICAGGGVLGGESTGKDAPSLYSADLLHLHCLHCAFDFLNHLLNRYDSYSRVLMGQLGAVFRAREARQKPLVQAIAGSLARICSTAPYTSSIRVRCIDPL